MSEARIYTDAFVANNSWNGREQNHYLLNTGDGAFVEAGTALGLDDTRDGRGVAIADYDLDGDADIVVHNYRTRAGYFLNTQGQERAWIAIRLQGTTSNRDAVGAEVTVVVGGRRLLRLVGAGHGFAGQLSLEQVVGLDQAERVDEVEVRWPTGHLERFGPAVARQRITLVEGEGSPVGPTPPKGPEDGSGCHGSPWAGGLAAGVVLLLLLRLRRRA